VSDTVVDHRPEPPAGAEATTPAGPAPRSGWLSWPGIVLLGFVLCEIRPIEAGERFAFWGEDGGYLSTQPRQLGIWTSFHTTYAGYLHLIPRSVGAIGAVLPITYVPPLFALSACVVAAVAGAVAWHSLRAVEVSSLGAGLIAAAVVLLPAAGFEVVDNLTNVQWYCLAAATIFFASWLAGYRPRPVVAAALLVIAGLTTPLLAAALPFILVVTILRRRRIDVVVLLAVVVGTVAQGIAHLISSPPTPITIHVSQIVRLYAERVGDGGVLGDRLQRVLYDLLTPRGAEIVGVVVVLVVLGATVARPTHRLPGLYLLYTSVVLLVASVALRPDFTTLPNVGYVLVNGVPALVSGRYMAVPGLCVTAAAVLLVDPYLRRGASTSPQVLARVVVAGIAVMLVANTPVNLERDTLANWRQQVAAARATCSVHHDIGIVSIVNGPFNAWEMTLTCSQTFGSLPPPTTG
jgi:hypothetical protein